MIAEKPTPRPVDLVLRAYQQASSYLVLDTEQAGVYEVRKVDGSARYTATADTCTCPDHQRRGRVCKHSHLVRLVLAAEQPAPAPQPAGEWVPFAQFVREECGITLASLRAGEEFFATWQPGPVAVDPQSAEFRAEVDRRFEADLRAHEESVAAGEVEPAGDPEEELLRRDQAHRERARRMAQEFPLF